MFSTCGSPRRRSLWIWSRTGDIPSYLAGTPQHGASGRPQFIATFPFFFARHLANFHREKRPWSMLGSISITCFIGRPRPCRRTDARDHACLNLGRGLKPHLREKDFGASGVTKWRRATFISGSMSALGQKRTPARSPAMSALPPKADMLSGMGPHFCALQVFGGAQVGMKAPRMS
jgi:hypothetical protein